jgi:hypothetical protein
MDGPPRSRASSPQWSRCALIPSSLQPQVPPPPTLPVEWRLSGRPRKYRSFVVLASPVAGLSDAASPMADRGRIFGGRRSSTPTACRSHSLCSPRPLWTFKGVALRTAEYGCKLPAHRTSNRLISVTSEPLGSAGREMARRGMNCWTHFPVFGSFPPSNSTSLRTTSKTKYPEPQEFRPMWFCAQRRVPGEGNVENPDLRIKVRVCGREW